MKTIRMKYRLEEKHTDLIIESSIVSIIGNGREETQTSVEIRGTLGVPLVSFPKTSS